MSFYYETEGQGAFLTYKLSDDECIDSFLYGMLSNNTIDNTITPIYSQLDNVQYIKYNVSSRLPLSKYFENPVKIEVVLDILKQVAVGLRSAEEYLLAYENYVLDESKIFINLSNNSVGLICLPIEKTVNERTFKDFLTDIVMRANLENERNTNEIIGKLISFFKSEESVTYNSFIVFVDKLMEKPNKPSNTAPANNVLNKIEKAEKKSNEDRVPVEIKIPKAVEKIKSPVKAEVKKDKDNSAEKEENISLFRLLTNFSKENLDKYKKQNEKAASKSKISMGKSSNAKSLGFAMPGEEASYSDNLGKEKNNDIFAVPEKPNSKTKNIKKEKPVLSNFEDTVYKDTNNLDATLDEESYFKLTGQTVEKKYYLLRKSNNEQILLSQGHFKIGRSNENTDYCIDGNPLVGRFHAEFTVDEGKCYIEDMNSKNHTYINGNMIENMTKYEIANGDEIRLANEVFTLLTKNI